MRPFFVYMLSCRDGSYYVGHTDELEKRVAEHAAGVFPGYTSQRLPVELVWFAEMVTREDALERELQLKRWTRRKKEALIAGDWARVKALARGKDRVPDRPPFDYGPVERPQRSETGPTLRANGLGGGSGAGDGRSGPGPIGASGVGGGSEAEELRSGPRPIGANGLGGSSGAGDGRSGPGPIGANGVGGGSEEDGCSGPSRAGRGGAETMAPRSGRDERGSTDA